MSNELSIENGAVPPTWSVPVSRRRPAAAKGAMPIRGYAQIHNMFVAANGEGQFYDRLGELVKAPPPPFPPPRPPRPVCPPPTFHT